MLRGPPRGWGPKRTPFGGGAPGSVRDGTVTSLKPSCRTSSKFPRVRQASIVPAALPGRGRSRAAAAASSLCTQRLSAQLLGTSPESRMPLTGNLDPSQTSGLHWACSRGGLCLSGPRRSGSHRNSWARAGCRALAGGPAGLRAGEPAARRRTSRRLGVCAPCTGARARAHTRTRPVGGRASMCTRGVH